MSFIEKLLLSKNYNVYLLTEKEYDKYILPLPHYNYEETISQVDIYFTRKVYYKMIPISEYTSIITFDDRFKIVKIEVNDMKDEKGDVLLTLHLVTQNTFNKLHPFN